MGGSASCCVSKSRLLAEVYLVTQLSDAKQLLWRVLVVRPVLVWLSVLLDCKADPA